MDARVLADLGGIFTRWGNESVRPKLGQQQGWSGLATDQSCVHVCDVLAEDSTQPSGWLREFLGEHACAQ